MHTSTQHLLRAAPTVPPCSRVQWSPAGRARALAQWRALFPFGPILKHKTNVTLFSQGEEAHSVFLLASGIVKLVFTFSDGRNTLLGLRYPGHPIGHWWSDLAENCPVSAITSAPSELYRLAVEDMRSVEQRNQLAASFHREALERDLNELAATYIESKSLAPIQILEHLLWELAAVSGGLKSKRLARLALPLSNLEMANLCGLSESHYKEVRRELERTGRLRHIDRRLWILQRH